jgi:hypothetical protein
VLAPEDHSTLVAFLAQMLIDVNRQGRDSSEPVAVPAVP